MFTFFCKAPRLLTHCLITLAEQDLNVSFSQKQAARLLCPWDSAGKNTGVGCHFLLKGIFSHSGIKPTFLVSLALAGGFFTTIYLGSLLSTSC